MDRIIRLTWAESIFVAALVMLGSSQAAAQGGGQADQAREEAAKQAARQIAESVTRRVGRAALSLIDTGATEEVINGWVTPSYTNIGFDAFGDFDLDIYQIVGGADRRFGDFFFGASAGYARVEADVIFIHAPSFSPYVAYVINDNFLVTGIAGYSGAQVDDSEFDSNGLFTDLSLTGLLPVDSWLLSGKLGHRFSYSVTDNVPDEFDDDSYVNTLYATGEVGYRIERFLPYIRFNYEHVEPEEGESGDDSVFLQAGAAYDISDAMSIGLAYQHELNRGDIEYHQGLLELRFKL